SLNSRRPGRRKRRDRGKLFIGGLSFATKEGKLAEVFGKYGILEEVDVVRDTDTGRSSGFGFVKYADAKCAEDALEAMKGTTLDGKAIQVEGVRRWDQFRGGGESGSGPPSGPLKGGSQEGNHGGHGRICSRRWYGDRMGGCPVGESVCIQSTPAELRSPRMVLVPPTSVWIPDVLQTSGSVPGKSSPKTAGERSKLHHRIEGNGTAPSLAPGASSLATAIFQP
uniref:RRM domain-containing protein n=1 Tax=Neogobius melanostomus TaxID=47308 RepID=A0A8C6TMJ4_9GOBI